MKEYYFLTGKDPNGPFTIEQLEGKGLTNETLIWTEGMEIWQKLKDIPELAQTIKPKSVPPPPPPNTDEKIFKTEVSGQLNVTSQKTPNPALEAIIPNKTTLVLLIIWCSFHLFALLMSYSQIKIFNNEGKPDTKKFWPFVKYQSCNPTYKSVEGGYWRNIYIQMTDRFGNKTRVDTGKKEYVRTYHDEIDGEVCHFNGLFIEYDLTEFAFYVGGAILIYLLVRILNKKNENKIIKNMTQEYQNPQGQTVIIDQTEKKSNGIGIAGFVLAIIAPYLAWVPVLGWILWSLGLIFSFVGIFKTTKGLSIAGIIISAIGIFFLIK